MAAVGLANIQSDASLAQNQLKSLNHTQSSICSNPVEKLDSLRAYTNIMRQPVQPGLIKTPGHAKTGRPAGDLSSTPTQGS